MTLRHGAALHAELERLWSTLAGHKNNVIHMVDFLVDKGLEESMPDRVRACLTYVHTDDTMAVQNVQQYLAVAKRAALYLARTSQQQTIDSLVCEVQAMQAQDDGSDPADLSHSMELARSHDRVCCCCLCAIFVILVLCNNIRSIPSQYQRAACLYCVCLGACLLTCPPQSPSSHVHAPRMLPSFRPRDQLPARPWCLPARARCWTSMRATLGARFDTASPSAPPPASNNSPLVRHALHDRHDDNHCCMTLHCVWCVVNQRASTSTELTAPLRKAATELFKVTGISTRSDHDSDHESRLSASASASGFDGVLSSWNLEEMGGRSPSLSRTHSNDMPRRTRYAGCCQGC